MTRVKVLGFENVLSLLPSAPQRAFSKSTQPIITFLSHSAMGSAPTHDMTLPSPWPRSQYDPEDERPASSSLHHHLTKQQSSLRTSPFSFKPQHWIHLWEREPVKYYCNGYLPTVGKQWLLQKCSFTGAAGHYGNLLPHCTCCNYCHAVCAHTRSHTITSKYRLLLRKRLAL